MCVTMLLACLGASSTKVHVAGVQEQGPVMRLSYMLGTEPITMLPSPYLPDKCASCLLLKHAFLRIF
jgi:hypothetical protein